jgi:hypothetical protein
VDGAPHRGGMLESESMGAMRSCLNEIPPEFQEDSLGGARTLQKTSCPTYGALTLT